MDLGSLREDSDSASSSYSGIYIEIFAMASSVVAWKSERSGSLLVPSAASVPALRDLFLCVGSLRQRMTVHRLLSLFGTMLVMASITTYHVPLVDDVLVSLLLWDSDVCSSFWLELSEPPEQGTSI